MGIFKFNYVIYFIVQKRLKCLFSDFLVMSQIAAMEAEISMLYAAVKERGLSLDQLLKEKTSPLQERISSRKGELIAALTRGYHEVSFDHPYDTFYSEKIDMHMGIITGETSFPEVSEVNRFLQTEFLNGIKNACIANLSSWRDETVKEQGESFTAHHSFFTNNFLSLVYFMEEPPLPSDSPYWITGDHIGPPVRLPTSIIKEPRLELFIGNEESIPVIQKNLNGWQYTSVAKLLGVELPIEGEISKKIEQEQVELYESITSLEKKKLGYNPEIRDIRSQIVGKVKTAVDRDYHEDGVKVDQRLDAGVVLQLDLREFFSDRKARYEV